MAASRCSPLPIENMTIVNPCWSPAAATALPRRRKPQINRHSLLLIAVAGCFSLPNCSPALGGQRIQPLTNPASATAGVFVENRGQWADADIRFALNSGGVNVGLTDQGPRYQLFQTAPPAATNSPTRRREIRTVFPGARAVEPVGDRASTQRFNFHRGTAERWRDGVAAWDSVIWRQFYPGVDLRVTGRSGGVKSDFIVAPGADWRQVRVRYEGIERLELQTNGALAVFPAPGWPALVEGAPVVYQEVEGRRAILQSRYELVDERTVAFVLKDVPNPALPLVLDPEFGWGVYIGGTNYDGCGSIALNAAGELFVSGITASDGWVSGGYDTSLGSWYASSDGFVAKLNTNGTPVWSTFLGGAGIDIAKRVTVDGAGNVLVVGETTTTNWVSGGYDTTNEVRGGYEGFIVKLSPSGSHLWSSFIGGYGQEYAYGVATDAANDVYICGEAWPSSYFTNNWLAGGLRTNFVGSAPDNFVVKLTSGGAHVWSGLVGGLGAEYYCDLTVDSATNIILVGQTDTGGWVTNGYDLVQGGGVDAYVAKISPLGEVLWSTYLKGGPFSEYATCVITATNQDIIVAGGNATLGYPGTKIAIARLNPAGALLWETFYGAPDGDSSPEDVALNAAGEILVTGRTTATNWVFGGPDLTHGGGIWQIGPAEDGFVLKLNSTGEHLWSSYDGGSSRDIYYGIAVNNAGRIYCAGLTYSAGSFTNIAALEDGAGVVTEFIDSPPFSGDLRVTFTPPEASAAGVQWRRVGTTNWLNSGDLETNLPTGFYTIEIKETIGWLSTSNFTLVLTNAVTNELAFAIQPAGSDFTWAGYVGGTGADRAQGVAADRNGNVVVVGYTDSAGWVSGGPDTIYNARDGFVAKFAADGTPLWSTYLGGTSQDYARGVALDPNGNVLVVGETPSSSWISGGYDTTWGGSSDGFVVKLSPAGAHLWSTYLGGSGADYGYGIVVDGAGTVYVAGKMGTANWATNGYDTTLGSNPDGFVARLDANGNLLWSSYLGGAASDSANAIALDGSGNVFIAGESLSTNWVAGGYQTNKSGTTSYNDAFLAKLAPDGSHLWSTFIGGTLAETGNGVAALTSGAAIVVGQSASSGWIAGGYNTNWTSTRAYAAVISPQGTPVWSTFMGPASADANAVAVNPSGAIYVAGYCSGNSTNWVANGADNTRNGGSSDAFLVRLGDNGAHHWSTFYGGALIDQGLAVASATNGVVYLAGYTTSTNLWMLGNPDATANGGEDAFVVRMLDRYQPRGPITIQQIVKLPGDELQLLTSASGWAVEALNVEGTESLTGNPTWSTESTAVFQATGAGLWDIRLPLPATNRFFRIHGSQ